MSIKFKNCPFCGKSVATFSTVKECENCANFEDSDCPECFELEERDGCIHFVVCDKNQGGCGASTGWYLTAEAAAEAWNNR